MSSWHCSCGRTVPLEVEFCRCGRSRTVETAAPTRSTPSDGKTIRLVGAIALVGALGFGAYRWYASYTPPVIPGYNAPAPEARPADPQAAPPTIPPALLAPRPTPSPDLQPTPWPAFAVEPTALPAAAPKATASPLEIAVEGPSETDQLKERIATFRAQYGPVKRRIEQLEREVAELSDTVSRSIGGGNSGMQTAADAARARLGRAKDELIEARAQLMVIEENARRAGVSYGQLY